MGCPLGYHAMPELEATPIFDHTSVVALSAVTGLFATAWISSSTLVRTSSTIKVRVFFVWHLFNALIHVILGASFLYNVFVTSMSKLDIAYTRGIHSTPMTPIGMSFLGDSDHLYGSFYGSSLTAKLWQEYAKADKRWGGSDLTVVSVGLLTELVIAPLTLYVCYLLRTHQLNKAYFWMAVVAAGELYGGLMTFLPEWLTGSPHLDTSNFLTLWVYLIFLRGLWLLFPLWILGEAHQSLTKTVQPKLVEVSGGSAEKHPVDNL
jgi:hypothetical protein